MLQYNNAYNIALPHNERAYVVELAVYNYNNAYNIALPHNERTVCR